MELFLLNPDGSAADWANIDDGVWNANQTQIVAWIGQKGLGYTTYAQNDTTGNVLTLTNLDQVQVWIMHQESVSASRPPAPSSSSSSGMWGAVAAVALLVGGGIFLVAKSRR